LGTFATAINCTDGRVQLPVIEYVRQKHGVDFVDMITEPGPNRILAENGDHAVIEAIKRRVKISVEKHNSRLVVIVGHHDCAGNPVEEETQREQTRAAVKLVESWGLGATVVGLWVTEHWKVRDIG